MNTPLPADDDGLFRELGAALRSAPPITNDDLGCGIAAYTWRTIDQDLALAELIYDSSLQEAALVRGADASGGRTLIFEAEAVSVKVDTTPDTVTGWVVPPARASVSLLTVEGTASETTTDDMGCFVLPDAPSGPARLVCRTPTTRLVTDWFRL